jgi:predicted dehydrogenase
VPSTVVSADRPADQIFAHEPFLRSVGRLLLINVGPHDVNTVRFLFGDPASVYARTHKVTPNVVDEEVATPVLGYPSRTALIELSWATVADRPTLQLDTLTIEGTGGHPPARVGGAVRAAPPRRAPRASRSIPPTAYRRSWTAALAHFADCLERDAPFETHGAQALATMRAVFSADESARTGDSVRLPT